MRGARVAPIRILRRRLHHRPPRTHSVRIDHVRCDQFRARWPLRCQGARQGASPLPRAPPLRPVGLFHSLIPNPWFSPGVQARPSRLRVRHRNLRSSLTFISLATHHHVQTRRTSSRGVVVNAKVRLSSHRSPCAPSERTNNEPTSARSHAARAFPRAPSHLGPLVLFLARRPPLTMSPCRHPSSSPPLLPS